MSGYPQSREWHYQAKGHTYLTSTEKSLLDDAFIQASFASDDMYWAKPMPMSSLQVLKETSCFVGLYVDLEDPTLQQGNVKTSWKQVGMARLVTDYTVIAFLTDVFILPEHRGDGLGKWLIQCVRDLVHSMPELRRVMLMAKNAPHAIRFYDELLGVQVFEQDTQKICFMSSVAHGLDGHT